MMKTMDDQQLTFTRIPRPLHSAARFLASWLTYTVNDVSTGRPAWNYTKGENGATHTGLAGVVGCTQESDVGDMCAHTPRQDHACSLTCFPRALRITRKPFFRKRLGGKERSGQIDINDFFELVGRVLERGLDLVDPRRDV